MALALPSERRADIEHPRVFAPSIQFDAVTGQRIDVLRSAISLHRKIELTYFKHGTEPPIRRTLRPLGLYFWGKSWTLATWCELRNDFRSFRLDRMGEIKTLQATFTEEFGRSLADFLRFVGAPDQ